MNGAFSVAQKKGKKGGLVSTTKESVEEQEIAGNRDGDSRDHSRKTTEMVMKREQKRWSRKQNN